MSVKRWFTVALAAAVAVSMHPAHAHAAPDHGKIIGAGTKGAVADRYLVVLKDGLSSRNRAATAASRMSRMTSNSNTLVAKYGGTVRHVYAAVLSGFSATMTAAQAAQLASDASVSYVGQVHTVRAANEVTNPPSWGQDRIDQRSLPLDRVMQYSALTSGSYERSTYVLDTGVRASRLPRVGPGWDFIDNDNNADDCNGHGTHVAGTAGSGAYSVSYLTGNYVIPVRVLGCDGTGTTDTVVAGLDWAVRNNDFNASVAVLSFAGDADRALDDAAANAIESSLTVVAAAGNSNADACSVSPARVPAVITVGATDRTDRRAAFSNVGTCVDIFAPGVDIVSAAPAAGAVATLSGTSMAAAHVAGTVVNIIDGCCFADLQGALTTAATRDKVIDPGAGSPNRLLYIVGPWAAPTVTSTDFTENGAGPKKVGELGWITVQHTPRTPAWIAYELDGALTHLKPQPGASSTRIPVTLTDTKPHVLRVSGARDADFPINTSMATTFQFAAAPGTAKRTRNDLNGDGRADLAAQQSNYIQNVSYPFAESAATMTSTPDGFSPGFDWLSKNHDFGQWNIHQPPPTSLAVTGDYNGDGRTDYALFHQYNWDQVKLWVFLSTGTGYADVSKEIWDSGHNWWMLSRMKLVAGDFTGDGREDIGVFYNYDQSAEQNKGTSGILVFSFNATGGLAAITQPWVSNAGWWDWNGSKVVAGDFDGDRVGDIAVVYDHGKATMAAWTFAFGNAGSSLRSVTRSWRSNDGWWDAARTTPRAGDINGDGVTDIIAMYDYGAATTALWAFTFNPSGATVKTVTTAWQSNAGWWDAASSKIASGDYDGDGKTDIAVFYNYANGPGLWIFTSNGTHLAPLQRAAREVRGMIAWSKIQPL